MAFQTNPRSILYGFPKENILGTTILFFIVKVVDPIIQNLCTMFKKKKNRKRNKKKDMILDDQLFKNVSHSIICFAHINSSHGLEVTSQPTKSSL